MILRLISLLPLLWMIRTDLRERMIHTYPLLLFGVLQIAAAWVEKGGEGMAREMLANGISLALLCLGVMGYYAVRKRGWGNPFGKLIGKGDFWFIVCLLPAFAPVVYLRFLVIAFLFSLLGWGIYTRIRRVTTSIPLVATVGMVYLVYFMIYYIC